jgi:hypothetical protein
LRIITIEFGNMSVQRGHNRLPAVFMEDSFRTKPSGFLNSKGKRILNSMIIKTPRKSKEQFMKRC